MDIYHIWCSLKDGVKDMEFSDAVHHYLTHLKDKGEIEDFRVTVRKLGLGPPSLPSWHIMLEFKNLTQLDDAFTNVSTRKDPVESFHHAVNSKVKEVIFALYRDFPDDHRVRGEEKF